MADELDRLTRIEMKIDGLICEVSKMSALLPSLERRLDGVEETLYGNDVDRGLCSKVSVLWYLVVVIGLGVLVSAVGVVAGMLIRS